MSTPTGVEIATRGEQLPDVAPADPNEVSSLVRLAVERGVDVGVLERLVALQERVAERNARAAFFEALAAVQEEVPEVPKTGRANIKTRSGADYGYSYAPLEAITRTIRPVLRRHGLSYSWDVQSADGGVLNVVCVLRHIEGHEERANFPVPIDSKAAMSDAQKNGAALTYGRRQSLIAVLGLTTADEDNDGAAPAEARAGTISRSQAADIEALADEVGADKARFLGWLGVETFADIPVGRAREATQALERKREERR